MQLGTSTSRETIVVVQSKCIAASLWPLPVLSIRPETGPKPERNRQVRQEPKEEFYHKDTKAGIAVKLCVSCLAFV